MNNILWGIILVLYVVIVVMWLKRRTKFVVETPNSRNYIDGKDLIAMPRELTIMLIEDEKVDHEAYGDLILKTSDLINGTYKIPKRFLKEKRNVIEETDEPEEKVEVVSKQNVNMDLYSNVEDESNETV